MANYYRCYIKNFSVVAEPLYALTRTGCKWYWDEQCERAFDDLRHRLLKEPVILTYPCWEQEFHIEADACATGVGAVLGQINERTGKVIPIEYFSSPLSPSQRNYSAGQLEALATIAATRKWAVYLIDRSSPTYRSLSFEVDPGPKGSQAHVHSMAHGTTRNATAYRDAVRQG